MTSSNLPSVFGGGLPATPSMTTARMDRAVTRYTNEASVALQKERIDQEAFFYGALHGLALECMLADVAQVAAGNDPIKQQLAVMKIATFAEGNNARLLKRFGGAR